MSSAGNALPAEVGSAETIHGAFGAAAAAWPTRTAVRDASRSLTYGELQARVHALAHRLRAEGVKPGDHVGIYLDRSTDLVAAVLGVLATGAAFVPLDPDFPADRIAMMVDDAGVRVVVTEDALETRAPGATRVRMESLEPVSADNSVAVGPDQIAYLIYTSGSTGRPKGVRVAHGSVVNLLRSVAVEPGIAADDVWLAITTLSFDIAMLELLGPVLVGATTAVASREEVLDGALLARALERYGATIMQATPVAWRLLLEAGWAGDARLKALCGGEALSADLARTLVARCGSLWNMYGPTETTIWSTCYRVPESGSPVLIGRPVANTSVYVLDHAMRPLPPGVPGEIWIGGAGVALGYHEREEMTRDRFLPDPFAGVPGARMYRTGDNGRYLRDGNLEYRNRVDAQLKIRGFRVEPAEIESAIVDSGAARQAAVVRRTDSAGDDRLVAFMVPAGAPMDADVLRNRLRERLPGYMVPQHFVEIDALPTTPNGKLDRRALEQRTLDLPVPERAFVPARTPAEALVTEVYADVLQLEKVSADADFFDLGGHSVLAMRVIARLRDRGAQLTLRDIFEASSVEQLAARDGMQSAVGPARSDDREVLVF